MWEYNRNIYRLGEYIIQRSGGTPPMLFVSSLHTARYVTTKLNELDRFKIVEDIQRIEHTKKW